MACSSSTAGSATPSDASSASEAASPSPTGDASPPLDEDASDIDVPAAASDTATRGTSTTSLADAKAVSELFVQEDPTINPANTAGQNADAIAAQLTSKLAGDGGTCAGGQISHVTGGITVSVAFGTGCSIPSLGLTLSGSASATVTKAAGSVNIAFTFTNLDVNGLTLDGAASESTADGTTFTSRIDVTESTHHVVFDGTATLDANAAGVTLTGGGTYQDGIAPSVTYEAASVHHTFGACYADAGTLSFVSTLVSKRDATVSVEETLTFSSTTPSTGQAVVVIDGVSSTETLPTYGSCPPS